MDIYLKFSLPIIFSACYWSYLDGSNPGEMMNKAGVYLFIMLVVKSSKLRAIPFNVSSFKAFSQNLVKAGIDL